MMCVCVPDMVVTLSNTSGILSSQRMLLSINFMLYVSVACVRNAVCSVREKTLVSLSLQQ